MAKPLTAQQRAQQLALSAEIGAINTHKHPWNVAHKRKKEPSALPFERLDPDAIEDQRTQRAAAVSTAKQADKHWRPSDVFDFDRALKNLRIMLDERY